MRSWCQWAVFAFCGWHGCPAPYVKCLNVFPDIDCAEQRQRQGGGMPSVEGISATVRAAKAAFLEPLLRAVLGWTGTSDYAEDQLRDACL
jgi:hypothetical protein